MADVRELTRKSTIAETTGRAASTRPTDTHEHGRGREHEDHAHRFESEDPIRIALVALAATLVWFRVWEPFPASAYAAPA